MTRHDMGGLMDFQYDTSQQMLHIWLAYVQSRLFTDRVMMVDVWRTVHDVDDDTTKSRSYGCSR